VQWQFSGCAPVLNTAVLRRFTGRGGDGSIEVKQAIDRIEHLLVTNEFSDRVYDLRDGDTKTVRNLLAYRKVGIGGDTEEFWVPPTVFDKEFVVGVFTLFTLFTPKKRFSELWQKNVFFLT
jgi:putative DNA primase/helicase